MARRDRSFPARVFVCVLLAQAGGAGIAAAQLAGAYTIGGQSPSYATLGAAVSALAARGVSGPVVFNVRPGTYTEQLNLPVFAGASNANTILFQSENGNASSVVLQFAAVTDGGNFVLRLNGTSHIRFARLSFSTSSFGAGFRRIITLKGRVDDVRFDQDIFTGFLEPMDTGLDHALIYAAAETLSNIVITRSTFTAGGYAIYLKGATTNRATGTRVAGNLIGSAANGISLTLHTAPAVDSNAVSTYYEGIGLNSCDGRLTVRMNWIDIHLSSGVTLMDCLAPAQNRGLICNNFVGISEAGNGLYAFASRNLDFFHNTVFHHGNSAAGAPFYEAGANSGSLNVVDNLLINVGSGYAYFADVPAGIAMSDYNDLLSTGPRLASWGGVDQPNLAALKAASGKDLHSVTRAVGFASMSDFHLVGASVGDPMLGGTPLASVPYDIDGMSRSTSTPYMGADEAAASLAVGDGGSARAGFALAQNWPNPFGRATAIRYALGTRARVSLALYDLQGTRVATLVDRVEEPGEKLVELEGRRLRAGIYFYRLEARGVSPGTPKLFAETRKLIVVR